MAKDATNERAVSNEAIIAALMENGTIAKAAAAAGISSRALYDRMGESAFKIAYSEAKAALIRQALHSVTAKIEGAIDTIADIMQNGEVNPAVRLQAAQTILNNAAKFAERLKAEDTGAADARSNPFDMYWG